MPTKSKPKQFKLISGLGFLMRKGGPKEHPLYQGSLAIGQNEYQLRGFYDLADGQYKLELREYDTWITKGLLTLSKPKNEVRKGRVQLDGKRYAVEARKGVTSGDKPCLRLRVPDAFVPEVH